MFDAINTALALVNILFGFMVVVLQFHLLRRLKVDRWIRVLFIANGLYWMGVYSIVLFAEPRDLLATTVFGHTVVRPGITMTLGLVASWSISRFRGLAK